MEMPKTFFEVVLLFILGALAVYLIFERFYIKYLERKEEQSSKGAGND